MALVGMRDHGAGAIVRGIESSANGLGGFPVGTDTLPVPEPDSHLVTIVDA
jgi:hypothetical protein